MKKWYDEEYEFTVEVTGFLHGDHTERYCRNGEEIGDVYRCTYGCPVNADGCVIFKLTAKPLGNENFHTGGFYDYPDETLK
ncbi:hypothetical protein [Butyrivibrio sp. WCD2001]|uniref:hypothetical protein n=1 Tax=Butyrivibrio sp. WCD2001 TaxID=1280681 RepID=UPI00041A0E66|nr:hypothetical protein [Butyrivibrio sp. WCD2001]